MVNEFDEISLIKHIIEKFQEKRDQYLSELISVEPEETHRLSYIKGQYVLICEDIEFFKELKDSLSDNTVSESDITNFILSN